MSNRLAWWIRRFRAMPAREVLERSYRAVRVPVDRLRMRYGIYARTPPALERWPGPSTFYFSEDEARTAPSDAQHEAADALLRGQRRVLGLGWITVPASPWHYEPAQRSFWPTTDALRVRRSAPESFDPRLTWELNRGHHWVLLARMFAGTGDHRYRDHLAAELASWQRANPIGLGINWNSPMEAAIRIHSFAWIAGFLRGDTSGLLPSLAKLTFEHCVFVADHLSSYSSANNHVIVELSALVIGDRCLGLDRWRTSALAQLQRELRQQVYTDGVDAEMATHYHELVLEAVLLVATLEAAAGAPDRELERVAVSMSAYLASITVGDGLLHQGDHDDGEIAPLFGGPTPHRLVNVAAGLSSTKSWLSVPARVDVPARSQRFRESGQVVLRGPRLLATFDAGPFGFGALAAHAHCDALSVNVAFGPHAILVDRGTYRYNGDSAARDRFRLTAAHNTVQVASKEQATAVGPFLWTRRPTTAIHTCDLGEDYDFVDASHDGFAPIHHRRRIVRSRDLLLLIDSITESSDATSRFHFPPELRVTQDVGRGVVQLATSDGLGVGWLKVTASTADTRTRLVQTDHSPMYGALETATTLEVTSRLRPNNVIAIVIGSGDHAEAPALEVELLEAAARRGWLPTLADA
jgi:hypothetical protein